MDKLINTKFYCKKTHRWLQIPIDLIIITKNIEEHLLNFIHQLKICSAKESTTKDVITIITDNNCFQVLGKKITKILNAKFQINLVNFNLPLQADDKAINHILPYLTKSKLVIAVGSGTINDLAKYASYKVNIPYCVLPTAPSMNGYASANSSITINNYKKTLKSHLPKAILVDINTLINAPKYLIKAGIADSFCRSTIDLDWKFTSKILPFFKQDYQNNYLIYDKFYLDYIIDLEQSLYSDIIQGKAFEEQNILKLFELLLKQGFLMYYAQSSMPASQSEHMLAHFADMFFSSLVSNKCHGEKIAVTTIIIRNLQEKFLSMNKSPILQQKEFCTKFEENIIFKHSDLKKDLFKNIMANARKEYLKKMFDSQQLNDLQLYLNQNWENVKKEINQQTFSSKELESLFTILEMDISYSSLGWNQDKYKLALTNAHFFRDRFTFLDLNYLST